MNTSNAQGSLGVSQLVTTYFSAVPLCSRANWMDKLNSRVQLGIQNSVMAEPVVCSINSLRLWLCRIQFDQLGARQLSKGRAGSFLD
jgi:hypothetical protein